MADLETLNRRLDELEAQAAFQDELYQKLNDVVARQDGEIIELRRHIRDLNLRLAEVRDAAAAPSGDPASEVPPHY